MPLPTRWYQVRTRIRYLHALGVPCRQRSARERSQRLQVLQGYKSHMRNQRPIEDPAKFDKNTGSASAGGKRPSQTEFKVVTPSPPTVSEC